MLADDRVDILSSHPRRWLLLILLLGLGLRLWQTGWGLPYNYQVSEPMYTFAAQNVEISGWHPLMPLFSFYQEILLLERWLVSLLLPALDRLRLSDPLSETLHSWMVYHLVGRFINGLLGGLTALPIYLIGKRLRGTRTGLLAALFWSVCFLSVRNSHFAKPDATTCFLVTFCAYLCIQLSPRRPGLYVAAGVLAGLAISSKLLAWPVVVLVLAFHILGVRRDHAAPRTAGTGLTPGRRWADWVAPPIVAGLSTIAGFCAGSPQALLAFRDFVYFWKWVSSVGKEGGMDRFDIRFGHPTWQIYANAFDWGLGVPLLLLTLAGVIWLVLGVRRRSPELLLLLLFPLFLYAFLLLPGNMAHDRYVMMGLPYLLLAAASLLAELPVGGPGAPLWARVALPLAVVVAVAPPLYASVLYDRLLSSPDTRTMAKAWIEENVPAGSRVALEVMWYCPQLDSEQQPAPLSNRQFRTSYTGAYGLSERSKYTGPSQGSLSIDNYRRAHVDYVVSDGYSQVLKLIDPEQDRRRKQFYRDLDAQATLVKTISPLPAGRAIPFFFDQVYGPVVDLGELAAVGPEIKIYRLSPSANPLPPATPAAAPPALPPATPAGSPTPAH